MADGILSQGIESASHAVFQAGHRRRRPHPLPDRRAVHATWWTPFSSAGRRWSSPPRGRPGPCGSGARRGSPCAWSARGSPGSRRGTPSRPARSPRRCARWRGRSPPPAIRSRRWRWRRSSRSRRPSCSTSPPPWRGRCGRTTWVSRCGWPSAGTGAWIQVVGPRLVPGPESEAFYSCAVESSWGRYGALLPRLAAGAGGAVEVAAAVVALFRARQAPSPAPIPGSRRAGAGGGGRAAARGGGPCPGGRHPGSRGEPGVGGGRRHGRSLPRRAGRSGGGAGSGPPDHRRRGSGRRPPLAAARRRGRAAAGGRPLGAHLAGAAARERAGGAPAICRRGRARPTSRSCPARPPKPTCSPARLEGLYLPEASRGALDPLSGEFALYLPYARRFRRGALAETVGPCVLRGRVADLLTRVVAVGAEAKPAGAGWCAKGGRSCRSGRPPRRCGWKTWRWRREPGPPPRRDPARAPQAPPDGRRGLRQARALPAPGADPGHRDLLHQPGAGLGGARRQPPRLLLRRRHRRSHRPPARGPSRSPAMPWSCRSRNRCRPGTRPRTSTRR